MPSNVRRDARARRCLGTGSRCWLDARAQPNRTTWNTLKEVPVQTAESDALSQDLKRRGFKFVGSSICYAFMHAVGMVNDHLVGCFRHAELSSASGKGRG